MTILLLTILIIYFNVYFIFAENEEKINVGNFA